MELKLLRIFVIGLCLGCAALSATLTYNFMKTLGTEFGSPTLMALVGLMLDVTKTIAPIVISIMFAQKMYASSAFSSLLTIALCVISFAASTSAIEAGVNKSKMSTQAYAAATAKIESIEQQISRLESRVLFQQDANQITKSQLTIAQIGELSSKLEFAVKERANLDGGETVATKWGKEVSFIVSAALELASIMLSLGVYAASKAINAQSSTVNTVATEEEHTEKVITQEQESVEVVAAEDSLSNEISEAILAKQVAPSFRGVAEKFKASREQVRAVLEHLHEQGALKPYRNGFTLVEA